MTKVTTFQRNDRGLDTVRTTGCAINHTKEWLRRLLLSAGRQLEEVTNNKDIYASHINRGCPANDLTLSKDNSRTIFYREPQANSRGPRAPPNFKPCLPFYFLFFFGGGGGVLTGVLLFAAARCRSLRPDSSSCSFLASSSSLLP